MYFDVKNAVITLYFKQPQKDYAFISPFAGGHSRAAALKPPAPRRGYIRLFMLFDPRANV